MTTNKPTEGTPLTPRFAGKMEVLDGVALSIDGPIVIDPKLDAKCQADIFKMVLGQMSQGLCLYGSQRQVEVCNARFLEIYDLPVGSIRPGMTLEDILQLRIAHDLIPDADQDYYIRERLAVVGGGKIKTTIHHLRNGKVVSICHKPLPNSGWLSTHEDITKVYNLQQKITHMAYHDSLTGLPNRAGFDAKLSKVLQENCPFSLLSFDLDGLKAVNDQLGHAAGDQLLKLVATRLNDCIRRVDAVARLGGDEFVIIQPGQPSAATALAGRLLAAIGAPMEINNQQVKVSASVGIAILLRASAELPASGGGFVDPVLAGASAASDLPGTLLTTTRGFFSGTSTLQTEPLEATSPPMQVISSDELMRQADVAMYVAKRSGGDCYRVYAPELEAKFAPQAD